MVKAPTRALAHTKFAQWSSPELTTDWTSSLRNSGTVVPGHLYVPLSEIGSVRFEEVSFGYSREWRARAGPLGVLRTILPRSSA